jgi:hypothetical protein
MPSVKQIAIVLLAGALWQPAAATQVFTPLQQRLFDDIADQRLDHFTIIEAAFILSGATHADSLQHYLDWYDELVGRIQGFNFDPFDRVGSANKVFQYIRTTLYEAYQLDKTTLLDIVNERRYNCVSATLLYNAVCDDLGWQSQAFETPTHVYTVFRDLGQELIVENTHPMGFDIMQNLQAYSEYLASFYPDNRAYSIGLDKLYAYENSKGRLISNAELLGCLAYNQAYFAAERNDYAAAYELVLIAQDFNRDSRSNRDFEIGLYYRWGKQCFDAGRFFDAFEVFADGYYRHPGNDDLARNTRAAFFNALRQLWHDNNWQQSRQLLDEIDELELLSVDDRQKLPPLLRAWIDYLTESDRQPEAAEAAAYHKKMR